MVARPAATMRLECNHELDYVGFFGRPARCHVRVWRDEGADSYLVIVTERPDNPGTSIDNAVAHVADAVARHLAENRRHEGRGLLDPDQWDLLTHFPAVPHSPAAALRVDRYALVTFLPDEASDTAYRNPTRTRLRPEHVRDMLGHDPESIRWPELAV